MADLTQYSTDELFTQLKRIQTDPSSKCQVGKNTYKKIAREKMDEIGHAMIKRLQQGKTFAACSANA